MAKGHAQVQLVRPDGTGAHRVPLGFWDDQWDAHNAEPWHGHLSTAFRVSMTALQRHEESDTRAALRQADNNAAVLDPNQEARLLDREMSALESIDLDKITADLTNRRSALSPFAVPIDKTDANTAALRTELRGYLRGLPPMERLAATRGNVDEATASAILSAPPHLSGLSEEQWGNFREARLRLRHPQKLASLDAAAAATKLVSRTLAAARTSTRERYLPLLPAAPAEVKPLSAPWVP
jgi:hypothetical protein